MKAEITHRELCLKAAKYLKNKGIQPFFKCQYVVCELERVGECPDVFGWCGGSSQLIEVKVSRSDFLQDKKKYWRKHPDFGLGRFRSYLCPEGLIKVSDLPDKWGLLYLNESGVIEVVKQPETQECCHEAELALVSSILRREGIGPQIFSYKKYTEEN